jgi:hypothetical protein
LAEINVPYSYHPPVSEIKKIQDIGMGAIIRPHNDMQSYVVISDAGSDTLIATTSLLMTNPSEWRLAPLDV